MFKLNFKIALRNIWRNRTSSLINISGLAIGLAACLLLLLYVAYEWSFDRQWKDADQIYQVMTNRESADGGIEESSWSTGNMVGPVLKQEYPVVKAMARMSWDAPTLIANGTNSFKRKARFADADILKIFSFTFIYGNAESALSSPGNVVLTESTARVLFGRTDVLNKSVRFDDKRDMKITGVIKDPVKNTSTGFDYLLLWSLYESLNDWV
ncbi:MAG: ABC transporter permease, partial [Pedobacter sp.]|nr:ABC transporter permease [Pedobacter sp.]